MKLIGISGNKNIPGIISWIANGYGYNSGSSPSAFSFNTSYQLSYIYYYSKQIIL